MIDRVIISTDDSWYADYWPLVAQAWLRVGIQPMLVVVGECRRLGQAKWGPVMHIPSVPGMPDGHLAKLSRMLTASRLPGVSMLGDIDMLPLRPSYFRLLEYTYRPGTLFCPTADAHDQPGRWTMYYLTADQATWARIVNPSRLQPPDLFESWRGQKMDHGHMNKDDPYQAPFSDESLLRWMLRDGQVTVQKMARGWTNGLAHERIDRADWQYHRDDVSTKYIDAHMIRPLASNMETLKPLADYVGAVGWEP
ncbi:MAG: hypothetical protein ACYTEQ_18235 [Planctomycetota bacterium]|jgi:hypothetical protein